MHNIDLIGMGLPQVPHDANGMRPCTSISLVQAPTTTNT